MQRDQEMSKTKMVLGPLSNPPRIRFQRCTPPDPLSHPAHAFNNLREEEPWAAIYASIHRLSCKITVKGSNCILSTSQHFSGSCIVPILQFFCFPFVCTSLIASSGRSEYYVVSTTEITERQRSLSVTVQPLACPTRSIYLRHNFVSVHVP
ncbi:hypothetical protein CPB83DRAFT_342126 [Crepidotus variabilis]|uniref:Uncharacterized protein n=1 Tax=Crepidotus variabilis TaxID=179855 RepID=A0A9P6JUP7_9AGAR|nr:hypothetical protein CPB83DRAFT_342126 [Crepidotus variabilis]